MWTQEITREQITETQLFRAIELFCASEDFISAITLAGAADEILGKLVKQKGGVNALDEEASYQCDMLLSFFGRSANPKEFKDMENFEKNQVKHINEPTIEFDQEQKAVDLITRAIENYKKLYANDHKPAFTKFEDSAAAWWRGREKQIYGADSGFD